MKSKSFRKIFLGVFFLIAVLICLPVSNALSPAGCSFAAQPQDGGDKPNPGSRGDLKKVIRISTWYHDYDLTSLMAYLAEEFPDYTFEYIYIDKSNYEPIIDSQLSCKTAPDIIFMDQEMVQKHAATRYIYNLTDICGGFDENAWKAFGYGNAIYAVPNTSQFECIYYNKDLFRNLGVNVPYSYLSFIGSCDRLREDYGIRPLAVSLKNPYALANSALAFAAADYMSVDRGSGFGGRLQYGRTNFTNELSPFINEWETLLEHEIFTKDMYTIDSRTAVEEFAGKEAAMIAGGPETYNAIIRLNPDMKIGTLPFFGTRGRLRAIIGGCDVGFAVNRNSPNRDLAVEVLSSLTTLTGQRALWRDRPGSQTYLRDTEFVNDEVYDGLTYCMAKGLVFSPWMDWGRELNGPIHYLLGTELQLVLLNKQTTAEAFSNVDKAVERILREG
jgi:multiple sugar transport system substrate-binding protein